MNAARTIALNASAHPKTQGWGSNRPCYTCKWVCKDATASIKSFFRALSALLGVNQRQARRGLGLAHPHFPTTYPVGLLCVAVVPAAGGFLFSLQRLGAALSLLALRAIRPTALRPTTGASGNLPRWLGRAEVFV